MFDIFYMFRPIASHSMPTVGHFGLHALLKGPCLSEYMVCNVEIVAQVHFPSFQLTGCEYGNKFAAITSSGVTQSCDAWIAQDPWKCYQEWWNLNLPDQGYCCGSCAQIYKNVSGKISSEIADVFRYRYQISYRF